MALTLSVIAAAGFNYGPSIIGWIIIGLIAGWLAGLLMRGGGFGIIGDIIVGIIGAFIGGLILSFFGIGANNWWETLITAVVGAVILIWIVRLVAGNRRAAV